MRLIDWLAPTPTPETAPRSPAEIRADLDRREADAVRRLTQVEESLLALTAEAGLEDLRRRLHQIRREAAP